jgi:hypothetical protein
VPHNTTWNLEQLSQLATIVYSIFTVLLSGLMAMILIRTNQLTHNSKKIELLAHFNMRYDLLLSLKDAGEPSETAPKHYWERFWSLQFDQFTSWLAGFVDPATFDYWMVSRNIEFQKDEIVHGITYKNSWAKAKDGFSRHKHFDKFIEHIHCGQYEHAYKLVGEKYKSGR